MDDDAFQDALRRARAGDETGFEAIWNAFDPTLERYLAGSGARDHSADLASTVWLEVVRGLDRFDGDGAGFRAWLFTIARHRLIDLRRSDARRPATTSLDDATADHDSFAADPAVVLEDRWSSDQAIDLLASLPPDQGEVILLRVLADLDVAAVARITGKPPGTVRVLAHRGLRTLAKRLAPTQSPAPGVTR
jgi:RNA polymerase sigma-70 factor (ECF subfamily)